MKTTMKIKGILGMADVTYDEFSKLCGLTRQTIYKYLNSDHLEDTDNGVKIIDTANKLMWCCSNHKLPLMKGLSKEDKMSGLRDAVQG